MLVDQKTEGVVVPLNENLKSEGRLELANSTSTESRFWMSLTFSPGSLSEYAVLGVSEHITAPCVPTTHPCLC